MGIHGDEIIQAIRRALSEIAGTQSEVRMTPNPEQSWRNRDGKFEFDAIGRDGIRAFRVTVEVLGNAETYLGTTGGSDEWVVAPLATRTNYAERAEVIARTILAKEWESLAHTARVVANLGFEATDDERAVAWLHDVVEDTHIESVDLRDMEFPETIIMAVELLSRPYGSDYETYKRNLLAATGEPGELARKVKLADARDNLWRCEQATGVPKWERLAVQRYRPLIAALQPVEKICTLGCTGPWHQEKCALAGTARYSQ